MKPLFNLLLILSLTTIIAAQDLETSKIVKRLDKNANVITSIELLTRSQDIKDVWKSFGQSKIIGLGEGTHGTSDFFKLKNRIIKYGIEEKGFKLILIEESFSNVFKLNDYVRNGNGTAVDALNKFAAWIYQTKEVVELVEYIRAYNKDKSENSKVAFLGFDVQSIAGVLSELQKNKVYQQNGIENIVTKLNDQLEKNVLYDFWNEETQANIKAVIAYLKTKSFENRQDKITNQLMILQLENGFTLWTNKNKWEDFGEKRDTLMANSVSEIIKITENPSVFLWGHNGHIMKYQTGNYKTMGLILADNFKSNYFGVGFDFNKGCFKAYGTKEKKHNDFCVEDAESGTTASVFKFSKDKIFFLSLKKAMKDKTLSGFLKKTPYYRQVQSVFDSSVKENVYTGFGEEKIKLWELYDGWIYVNETQASKFYK
jgi:erythromycin esterase